MIISDTERTEILLDTWTIFAASAMMGMFSNPESSYVVRSAAVAADEMMKEWAKRAADIKRPGAKEADIQP